MSERGDVADWLGTGLQSPLIGFDSRRRLKLLATTGLLWYGGICSFLVVPSDHGC